MNFIAYEGKQYVEKPQLIMRWPTARLTERLPQTVPLGYTIRTYGTGDEERFLELMAYGDFDPWDAEKLHYNMGRTLPDGWFFAINEESGRPIATVVCLHNYTDRMPFSGDIGWLVCDPRHRGQKLGFSLMAWATNRFLGAGYTDIRLGTEYYRLSAIKTYLRVGYLPVIYCEEVRNLWHQVCENLGWEYRPEDWPYE